MQQQSWYRVAEQNSHIYNLNIYDNLNIQTHIMVFGRKCSQHKKKNTLKEIPNINPKYIKCFFFPFMIFLSFFFFTFSFCFVNNAHEPNGCFSFSEKVKGVLKKYAIVQQMQMFKKENLKESW